MLCLHTPSNLFQPSYHLQVRKFRRSDRITSMTTTSPSATQLEKNKKKKLISFDVDGTLIHSTGADSNKLHKEAFSYAWRHVFNLNTHIDVIPHHGSTDPLILVGVCVHHGIPAEEAMAKLDDMKQAMIDYFLTHKERAGTGLEVLPGVVDLLTRLQRDHGDEICTCLVTGNLEPIAWGKMEALGIKYLFTTTNTSSRSCFGGFGSDYCSGNGDGMGWRDRAEFIKIAAQRCEQGCGPIGERDGRGSRDHFHVGDAPMDVRAAKAAGAHGIGVLTGIYTDAQLREASDEATLLRGLGDVEEVFKVLGISSAS